MKVATAVIDDLAGQQTEAWKRAAQRQIPEDYGGPETTRRTVWNGLMTRR